MVLYHCPAGKAAPAVHPCGRAAKALDDAGHSYDVKRVKGGTMLFWTWATRARSRKEVKRLSGQRAVPILVLDDGEVIVGSGTIARWASEHPPQKTASVV
jgi:glutathione S-transferase